MRIAQISPLFESVPPQKYGGTERVVSYLTEELVRQGHEVSLFASGDSVSKARLVPGCDKALRLGSGYEHSVVPHLLMFEEVRRQMSHFDILHFHTDYVHFPMSRGFTVPSLTTLHGRLDTPQLHPLYREFKEHPLVSISNSQRQPMPWANWKSTIYHGLPPDLYKFNPKGGNYAAFLGRIAPEKRPDRAIEIAAKAGIPLKIAAKVDLYDQKYFETKIKPMIDSSPHVEFVGEINDREKSEFLGNASVLLFPIDWPEPFGLTMIESMACGTPVISYRNGSAPEVVTEGVTGFLVNSIDEAVEKVQLAVGLDRERCYESFQKRFLIKPIVDSYVSLYQRLIDEFHEVKQTKRRHPALDSLMVQAQTTA